MLTVLGQPGRYCDGQSRRSFLQVGALGVGGLTLAGLMRAEAASGKKSHKSIIMVYLSGGMSHQDSFDPKPDAPAEVRGEFKAIDTKLPGVKFAETTPKLAAIADKLVVLRSVVGQPDEHSSWMSYTGTPMATAQREKKPHFGSVVAKVRGQTNPLMPAFIDLTPTMQHKPYNSPGPMNLGRGAQAVKVDGDEIAVMKTLVVPADQLQDRKALLERMDALKRGADRTGGITGTDTFHDRAFEVLTSNTLVNALDITKESPKLRDRYGKGSPKHMGDGAPMWNEQLIMARRLVEAGARVVTLGYGFWDTHGGHFKHMKQHMPTFDQGISALIEDIYARGLDKDCTVVVWGEFGRTPKINKDAGRDHWARVNFGLMSGGGMKVGQVIGSTDAIGGEAKNDPIPYPWVLATAYQNLGIDPHAMVYDVAGRPNPILPSSVGVIDKVLG